jgi:hypothetical protein
VGTRGVGPGAAWLRSVVRGGCASSLGRLQEART